MNRKSKYDECDWSKSDVELASLFGVTKQAISAARRVRGIKPSHGHGGKRSNAGAKPREV